MRRFALISSLALSMLALSATVASAETPTHQKFSFSVDFTAPAGTVCEVIYHDSFTVEINEILFGDSNKPTRIIVRHIRGVIGAQRGSSIRSPSS